MTIKDFDTKKVILEDQYKSDEYETMTLYFIAPKEWLEGLYHDQTQREEVARMAKAARSSEKVPKSRAALTPEAREKQLIALAIDVAEEQMRNGTASSQVISHFLKLGSTRAQIEKELLEKQRDLAAAKAEAIESSAKMEDLYLKAAKAMKSYQGQEDEEDEY